MAETGSPEVGNESVDRVLELDLDEDHLWQLIASADGWGNWLADRADISVEPGAHGQIIDGDSIKHVSIDDVEEGRRVRFTWWDDDDSSSAAQVEMRVEIQPYLPARLHITERRLEASGVAGSARCSVESSAAWSPLDRIVWWESRLWLLGACLLATARR